MAQSTCGGTRRCRSCSRGWGGTSRTTTRSGCTRPWVTGHRPRSIRRGGGRAEGGVGGEAFFRPRPPSAPVKGGRGRKNAWGQGRGGSSVVRERSSPLLELRKALFWSRQWGPPHRVNDQ